MGPSVEKIQQSLETLLVSMAPGRVLEIERLEFRETAKPPAGPRAAAHTQSSISKYQQGKAKEPSMLDVGAGATSFLNPCT